MREDLTLAAKRQNDLGKSAARVFAVNERINQMVIEQLDPAAWNAQVPLDGSFKTVGRRVRTIAAIFAHIHNVRTKWVRLSAPHLKAVPQLSRSQRSIDDVRAALADSASRCCEMLTLALGKDRGTFNFRRDSLARPWPAGLEMLCYMISHDSHHRGQVCMLAHQLGFPVSDQVQSGIWNWEKLMK